MKRRKFLLATTAALAVAAVPTVWYLRNQKKNYHPLLMPEELGNFCEEKVIREIGISYRKQVAAEDNKAKLEQLLLTDDAGKQVAYADKEAVALLMEKKTLSDFNSSNITIQGGWVISVTEARQCALFSLT